MPKKNRGDKSTKSMFSERENKALKMIMEKMENLRCSSDGKITESQFRTTFGLDPPAEVIENMNFLLECEAEAEAEENHTMFAIPPPPDGAESYEDSDQTPLRGREAAILSYQWSDGMGYVPERLSPWALTLWRGDYSRMLRHLEGLQGEELSRLLERRESPLHYSSIFHIILGTAAYISTLPQVDSSFMGAEVKHLACLEKLLDLGAKIDVHDVAGYTPLHCCLSSCCTEVELGMARLLLERGADPNARNRLGTVPLCAGLHVNSKESINLLLEFGADPGIPDNDGMTPQMLAMKSPDIHTLLTQNVKKRCQRLRQEAKAVGGLKKCRVCLTSDHSKRCAGCYLVWYCGPVCQKQDWAQHKVECQKTQAQYMPVKLDNISDEAAVPYYLVTGELRPRTNRRPTKDHFVVKVQVGCNVKGTHTMLIFNEERSIKGEIHPEQNPDVFPLIEEKMRSEGLNGNAIFFYATWSTKKKELRMNPHVVVPTEVW